MPLPTHCIFETGDASGIYDHAPSLEAAQAYAARMTEKTGKPYSADTLDNFAALSVKYWLARGPMKEIDEESYMDALECLPPIYKRSAMRGFFMCEFTSGTVTNQYVEHDGRYFVAAADITDPATWITPEAIAALSLPEWTVTGTDRQQGALGVSEPFTVTVRAASRDDAWQAAHKAREALGRADNFLATKVEQKGPGE